MSGCRRLLQRNLDKDVDIFIPDPVGLSGQDGGMKGAIRTIKLATLDGEEKGALACVSLNDVEIRSQRRIHQLGASRVAGGQTCGAGRDVMLYSNRSFEV